TSIPFRNLNRNDRGNAKRINQGGVMRALHSSQSIKRANRTRYADASLDISVRSGELRDAIVERAQKINPEIDLKNALKEAKKIVGKLTKAEAKEGESNRSIWLSQEEINTAAQTVVNILSESADTEKAEIDDFISGNQPGSLAIAA